MRGDIGIIWHNFDVIDSTHIFLQTGYPDFLQEVLENDVVAVTAKEQTGGIGSYGSSKRRGWASARGNIFCSCLIKMRSQDVFNLLGQLPLIMLCLFVRDLREIFSENLKIKWPNDIYLTDQSGESHKVGGLICEIPLVPVKGFPAISSDQIIYYYNNLADIPAGRLIPVIVSLGLNLVPTPPDFRHIPSETISCERVIQILLRKLADFIRQPDKFQLGLIDLNHWLFFSDSVLYQNREINLLDEDSNVVPALEGMTGLDYILKSIDLVEGKMIVSLSDEVFRVRPRSCCLFKQ